MKEKQMKYYYRLDIVSPEQFVDKIYTILVPDVTFGWEEIILPDNKVLFTIHCDNLSFLQNLCGKLQISEMITTRINKLEAKDWLAEWRQFFTPIDCGAHFVVLPPWLEKVTVFPNKIKILIEPKSAFGTGHHTSTVLCLELVSQLVDNEIVYSGQKFIDLGTGTGILGIACCKSGLSGLGVDIDPLAIDNAYENCLLNKIEQFQLLTGTISDVNNFKCNLLLANILADPLVEMSKDIYNVVEEHGYIILSGILIKQADYVIKAFMNSGFQIETSLERDEWSALLMKKSA